MPLSTKQMEYLALAWQCFESEPKINYEKFRSLANLSSAASARELMRVTKKKLREEYGALQPNGNHTPAPSVKATPKSNGKRALDGDDEEATTPTPSKKKARTPKKTATPVKVKAEPVVEEDEDDGELV